MGLFNRSERSLRAEARRARRAAKGLSDKEADGLLAHADAMDEAADEVKRLSS